MVQMRFERLISGVSARKKLGCSLGLAGLALLYTVPSFAVDFNLSSINGSNGFVLNGPSTNAFSGRSVDFIGDINGDGLSDVIVTIPYASPSGRVRAGEAYVIFGSAIWGSGAAGDPLAGGAEFNLNALSNADGFRIAGATAEDYFGFNASGVGDINGDGLADFAVTAPYGESTSIRRDQGEVYVLFGNDLWSTGAPSDPTGGTGVLEVSALQAGDGFVVRGEAAYDVMGQDVSAAQDINGDGIADLIIGTRLAGTVAKPLCGKAYVIFGSTHLGRGGSLDPLSGGSVWNNAKFNGLQGFMIEGAAAGDRSGFSVAGIGDFNGDGKNDLAIGSPLVDTSVNNEGQVNILYGTSSFGSGTTLDPLAGTGKFLLPNLTEKFGFSINSNLDGAQFGTVVAAAGDINADGIKDLIVGVPEGGNTTITGDREGNAYVILGSSAYTKNTAADPVISGIMSLSNRLGFEVFRFMGGAAVDNLGFSVAGVGDVTGDGIADFMMGIPNSDFTAPDAGRALLIPGSVNFGDNSASDPLASASTINLAAYPAGLGRFYNGISGDSFFGGDQAGTVVAGGKDFDGDGAPEILISAPSANATFSRSGETYIILGTPSAADVTGPVLTQISTATANGPYGIGSYIDIQLQFNEAVLFNSANGVPSLNLNSGGSASFVSGNGTPRLFFRYLVGSGQNTADLDVTSLALNGTTIRDGSNNSATLTLPSGLNSLGGSANILIDTIAPVLNQITTPNSAGLYSLGDEIIINLQFSEPVYSLSAPSLQLTLNSGGVAFYQSGIGTSTLEYVYDISANEGAKPLEVLSVPVTSPAITDAGGTTWGKALPTLAANKLSGSAFIEVDTLAPEILRFTSPTGTGFYRVGDVILIDLVVTEGITVSLNGNTPLLSLNNGGTAIYQSNPAANTLRFRYTIGVNQNTNDLDVMFFERNGATFTDQVGYPFVGLVLPTGTNSLAGSGDISIDSTPPSITGVTSSLSSGVYGLGTTIPITVTLSEPVTVTGTPSLTLSNGTTATYVSNTPSTALQFQVTVTPGSDTALLNSNMLLNAGGVTDAASNPLITTIGSGVNLASNRSIAIDATKPSIFLTTIDPAAGSTTNFSGYMLSYLITEANGPLSGLNFFDPTALVLTNATIDSVDSMSSSFIILPIADGPVTVQFAANKFTDAAGNFNTASNSVSYTSDRTPPTVSLASTEIPSGGVTTQPGGFEFSVTVDGASGSTVFNPQNPTYLLLTNATATTASVAGNVYTFDVVPQSDGVVSVQVPTNAVFDTAGNTNAATAVYSFTVSTQRPSVTVGSAAVSNNGFTSALSFPFVANFAGGLAPYSTFNPLVPSGVAATNATISKQVGDGTFGFTVTPQSEGVVTVQIPAGAISDAATNTNTASNTVSFTVDRTAPVATLSSAQVASGGFRTTLAPVAFSVSVVEANAFVDFNPQNPAHLQLTNATASAATKSGKTYSFTLTPSGDGVVSARVLAGAITDPVGLTNAATAVYSFTVSTTVPAASLSSATVTPNAFSSAATFKFTAAFTQGLPPYSGFNPLLTTDVVATNGTVTKDVTDGAFGFTVTPVADGPISVRIPAGAILDGASVGNTASSTFNFTSDRTPPTVSLSSSTLNSGDIVSSLNPVSFTVTFTDATALTTFNPQNAARFTATNAVVSAAVKSGNTYTFTLTPVGDGVVTARVRSAAVTDAAGNGNAASSLFSFTVSTGIPAALLSSPTLNSGDATSLSSVDFLTTFTSGLPPYTGFMPLDITDVVTTNALVVKPALSGEYEFSVQPVAEGLVSVRIPQGAITDSASTGNTASGVFTFTFDQTRPQVVLSSSAVTSGSLTNLSTPIPFTVVVNDLTETTPFNPQNASHLALTNATASAATLLGSTYSFTLSPIADGVVSAQLLASAVTDEAGNSSLSSPAFTFTRDTLAPSLTQPLTYSGISPTSVSPLAFTFATSEPLASFTESNVSVSAPPAVGPLTVVITSGASKGVNMYGFEVVGMQESGTVTVTLLTNQLTDAAGNAIGGVAPSLNVNWVDVSLTDEWMVLEN